MALPTLEEVDKRLAEIQQTQNKLTIEMYQLLGYKQRIIEEDNEEIPGSDKKPGDKIRSKSDKNKEGSNS